MNNDEKIRTYIKLKPMSDTDAHITQSSAMKLMTETPTNHCVHCWF